jgi:DNA-binding winged helix-turn-helix (wHTH) protein/tetratricopeptide (TPR) repeat protein
VQRRFCFDRFVLDERAGHLLDAGHVVVLQPKVWELLVLLLEHPGRLFSREELHARLWPDVHVTDDSLTKGMSRLRQLLGDSDVLQTLRGRGYRLVAEVAVELCSPEPVRSTVRQAPVGRAAALEAVLRGLASHGLVVVTGPPGIGRTTVLRAASQPHEGLVTRLEPQERLVPALATGFLELPSTTDAASVGRALAERAPALVCVDDLHLDPEAPALIARWRERAPRTGWLVSSRERPALREAVVVELGGLEVADGVELLSRSAGMELPAHDPALGALVRALDGNPLALVLAAPRLRVYPPAQLLARLAERFSLLRDGEQSLEASIGSAWDALGPPEREALVRLQSVQTPLPLGAAEAALGPGAPDLLQRLAETGWITLRPGPQTSWLTMPHNPRAWAQRQPGEVARAHALACMAAWLCEAGRDRLARRDRDHDPEAIRWLREHAELAAELGRTYRGPLQPALAVLAFVALQARGSPRASEDLLRAALDSDPPPAEHVELLIRLGVVRQYMGAIEQAVQLQREAAELALQLGDSALVARAWTRYALTASAGPDPLPLVARAQALASAEEPELQADGLAAEFLARRSLGGLQTEPLERAMALPLPRRSPTRSYVQLSLGVALEELGRLEEAAAVFREWLADHPHAPLHHQILVLGSLGGTLHEQGQFDSGEEWLQRALDLARRAGDLHRETHLVAWQLRGRLASGLPWQGLADRLQDLCAEPALSPGVFAVARLVLGIAAMRERDPSRALLRLREAHGSEDTDIYADAYSAIASLWLGQPEEAERLHLRACAQRPCRPSTRFGVELAESWLCQARLPEPSAGARLQQLLASWEISPGARLSPPLHRVIELRWLRPEL